MILFRHADSRFPFLWEDGSQPPARWHGPGEGPAQYFADTPDGAWAEFLRHEEIADPADLEGVRRALWAVEVDAVPSEVPQLAPAVMRGDPSSYPACRQAAARLRAGGHDGLSAPSAALLPGGARGWRVEGGLREGPYRDARVFALFGPRPDLVGWPAVTGGGPDADLLPRVRHFGNS